MPVHNNQSRGYFRALHGALLRQLRPIRAEELKLMRKKAQTSADKARLKTLSAARREITANIITLSDAEDAYLRTAKGANSALSAVKAARNIAVKTTRRLKKVEKALDTLSTLTKIVTDLARFLT